MKQSRALSPSARRLWLAALTALLAPLSPAVSPAVDGSAAPLPGAPALPARVVPIPTLVGTEAHPVTDGSGSPLGLAEWRVVHAASGNPYENYLAATQGGRLLNWGGSYLRFSDDNGVTWSSVTPLAPILSGEGAVVVAPGGDIIGATWDPYSGDRVLTFKFTASRGWEYTEAPLHTPFFDRPWIAVIPGPITVGGVTAPYVSVLKGGWPSKEIWYYSLDGLNYLVPSSTSLASLANFPTEQWLSLPSDARADWVQPHTLSGVTPLAGAGAMAARVDHPHLGCPWRITGSDLRWSCFSLPSGPLPPGRLLVDSVGRLHVANVTFASTIDYRVSTDGGQTWSGTTVSLPADHTVESWDVKTNAALGLTVVAVHAHRATPDTDQDLVFKFSAGTLPPFPVRIYLLGNGDKNFGDALNAEGVERFDFTSVAILPSGKIAASFVDASHVAAALAIEL